MGSRLMDDTSIPNQMLLEVLAPEFRRILHIDETMMME